MNYTYLNVYLFYCFLFLFTLHINYKHFEKEKRNEKTFIFNGICVSFQPDARKRRNDSGG